MLCSCVEGIGKLPKYKNWRAPCQKEQQLLALCLGDVKGVESLLFWCVGGDMNWDLAEFGSK